MNRGSETEAGTRRAAISASMRPRFMNRGSAAQISSHYGYASASMRPRFMNRGSVARAHELGPGAVELQ